MLGHSYFSHKLIKKYVVTFGTLFNDIYIERFDNNNNKMHVIKVPCSWAHKEKTFVRMDNDPDITRGYSSLFPTITFEITGFRYTAERHTPSINRLSTKPDVDKSKAKTSYNCVPWEIDFALMVVAKNQDDATKIVEQILPFFSPDLTVTIDAVEELGIKLDVPVILNGFQLDELFSKDFKTKQYVVYTMNFTMKAMFFGPVKGKKVIKFANTQYFIPSTPDGQISTVVGTLDPVLDVRVQPGLTANGQPTSNAELSIPVINIDEDDNFGFVVIRSDEVNE